MTEGPYKLPSGWRWVRLRDVVQREAVAIQPSKNPDRLFNYLGLEQLHSGQWEEPGESKVFGAQVKSTCFEFQPGFVLYAKLRPYLNKVVVCSRRGVASTEFVPLVPQPSTLTPEFLAAYLRSPWFVNYASHSITGSRMPRVSMEAIGNAPIPQPSLAEQRRIVARVEALMERVREAKRLRDNAITDVDGVMRAALKELFSFPGGLPAGWEWTTIADVGDSQRDTVQTGPFGAQLKSSEFTEEGVPVLAIGNVQGGYLDTTDLKHV